MLATSAVLTPIVSTSSSGMPRRGKALSPIVSALAEGVPLSTSPRSTLRIVGGFFRVPATAFTTAWTSGSVGGPAITTTSILPSLVRPDTSSAEIRSR